MNPLWIVLPLLAAAPLAAQQLPVAVPSGMAVQFFDLHADDPGVGEVLRYRFVAPEIGGTSPRAYSDVAPDMEFLCQNYALERLPAEFPAPVQIVVTLMAKPVEFGLPAPDTAQYFEAYSIREGRCIWEAF